MSDELEKFGKKLSWPNASFRYFHGITKENHGKSDDYAVYGQGFERGTSRIKLQSNIAMTR
jgi:hypothetical protein